MPVIVNGQIVITDRCRRVLTAWLTNKIMVGPSGGEQSQGGSLVGLKYFKLGTGGVPPPNPALTDLVSSVFQKDLSSASYEVYGSRHSVKIICDVSGDEAVGFGLNEIGIFDCQNNLICYGIYDTIYKLGGMVLTFEMRMVI